LLFVSCFCVANDSKENYSSEAIEIMKNIKCPICNGQSIYDSNNEISKKMRSLVLSNLNQGKNKIEIEEFFVNNFGNDIIIDNSVKYRYALYIIPLIMTKIIFTVLAYKFYRWKRKNAKI
jgi:cytochrome c-type biogenesis protein CcmH